MNIIAVLCPSSQSFFWLQWTNYIWNTSLENNSSSRLRIPLIFLFMDSKLNTQVKFILLSMGQIMDVNNEVQVHLLCRWPASVAFSNLSYFLATFYYSISNRFLLWNLPTLKLAILSISVMIWSLNCKNN